MQAALNEFSAANAEYWFRLRDREGRRAGGVSGSCSIPTHVGQEKHEGGKWFQFHGLSEPAHCGGEPAGHGDGLEPLNEVRVLRELNRRIGQEVIRSRLQRLHVRG